MALGRGVAPPPVLYLIAYATLYATNPRWGLD
jgi:hypothetical protein